MKMIYAQGDAEALKIKAAAEAEAYRLQAQAEAQEMQMKGYTYQQETARQVSLSATQNGGSMAGNLGSTMGDLMNLGVGLGAVGSVMGMAKEAITPMASAVGDALNLADSWNCSCGKTNISSKFCPECGTKRPEPSLWNCSCGKMNITSRFCPECGAKKPEAPAVWDCTCGNKGISEKFCPECGAKRPE